MRWINGAAKVVQQILQNLGYSPGPIDGKVGNQTQEAVKAFQKDQGLTTDGNPGKQTRAKLFLAYMDKHCRDGKGDPFKLEPSAFLAQGKDSLGKGDYQGCGEFNPLMLFSREEQHKYQKPENKIERDEENGMRPAGSGFIVSIRKLHRAGQVALPSGEGGRLRVQETVLVRW